MPTHASPRLLVVAAVALLGAPAQAQLKLPAAALKGMTKPAGLKGMTKPAGQPVVEYANKWALVVGTNYKGRNLTGFAELKNAEQDATAFYDMLLDKFGYNKNNTVKLIADNATWYNVTNQLKQWADKAGEQDSILVYFSGHGHRLPAAAGGKGGKLLLLPNDIGVSADPGGKTVLDVKAVDTRYMVELLERSPAKHKLVILDCCHAGGVFDVDVGRADSSRLDRDPNRGAFLDPAFQVIAASRASETASDGEGQEKNSPFTTALLQALESLGRECTDGDRRFRADELYAALIRYAHRLPPRQLAQSPLCRRIAGQGEFHFVLGAGVEFPAAPLGPDDLRLLMAMVPSTFGNWWADEIPWFMPSLRKLILPKLVVSRSGAVEVEREQLRQAALQALAQKTKEEEAKAKPGGQAPAGDGTADANRKRRALMHTLLTARGGDRWVDLFREATKVMVELTGDPKTADPTDLHYLAVLYHKQKDVGNARACYKLAEEKYKARVMPGGTDTDLLPVYALCLLDHGWLEFNYPERDGLSDAARLFAEARAVFGTKRPPKPFEMFTLCREADAYRKLGQFGRCEDSYRQALDECLRWDAQRTHLLTAAAYKQWAWSHMETWNVPAAVTAFHQAKRILETDDNFARAASLVDRFHVKHGLAMAARYQGRPDVALQQYRVLTPEIAREIHQLDESRTEVPNYAELRYLLYDRLVNSLQRQADCSLFTQGADLAEAADDYRRAIRECDFLAPGVREKQQKDLLYCRAVAVGLPIRRPAAHTPNAQPAGAAGLARPAPLDVQLAAHLYAEAERVDIGTEPDDRTRVVRCLARALIRRAGGAVVLPTAPPQPVLPPDPLEALAGGLAVRLTAAPIDDLQALLRELRGRIGGHDLTTLERLMFAYRYLIEAGEDDSRTDYQTLDYADDLLKLSRSACRLSDPDPHLLKYLRPYFDVAFRAKRRLVPTHAKELIEIAWEATRGVPYDKPHGATAVLVVYFAGDDCHLLLDADGLSRCFQLRNGWSVDDVAEAAKEGGTHLSLPDDVRAALRQVRGEYRLELRWRDPCLKLGYCAERTSYRPADHTYPAASDPDRPQLRFVDNLRLLLTTHGLAKGAKVVDEAHTEDRGRLIGLPRPLPPTQVVGPPVPGVPSRP